ncbi:ABC transporter permease subunit [bacterium]|nr:ABC transporter permease subunit [bacterium]
MKFKHISIAAAISLFLIYFILIFSMFSFVKPGHFFEILTSKRVLFSLKLSFITAMISTIFSISIAIPTAYALSRYKFPGSQFVDLILELPLVISPVALGAALLIFFNTSAGNFIQNNIMSFVYDVKGIILAQFITTAGLATRIIKAAMEEISPRYEKVARCLGASGIQSFRTITLPMLRKGIISAMIISFAKSLGEFGATVTLAGAMPGKTETISTAIYTKLASAHLEETVVLILILISSGITFIFLAQLLSRKKKYD